MVGTSLDKARQTGEVVGLEAAGAGLLSLGDRRAQALHALDLTEKRLWSIGDRGFVAPVGEVLRLITAAKTERVTEQDAPVGYIGVSEFAAEFGYVDSAWRLGGPVPATPVALAVSSTVLGGGAGAVSFNVSLNEPVIAFGMARQRFRGVLIASSHSMECILRLTVPGEEGTLPTAGPAREREYVFGAGYGRDGGIARWNDLPFEVRAGGRPYLSRG